MVSLLKTSAIKGIKEVSICSSVLKPRTSAGSFPKEITIDSTELVISWLAVLNKSVWKLPLKHLQLIALCWREVNWLKIVKTNFAFGGWVLECICNIPKHDSNKFRRTLKFVNITSALLCYPLHGWKNYFIDLFICWLPRLFSLISYQLIGVNQPIMQP